MTMRTKMKLHTAVDYHRDALVVLQASKKKLKLHSAFFKSAEKFGELRRDDQHEF